METPSLAPRAARTQSGCGQIAVIALSLVWLWAAPPLAMAAAGLLDAAELTALKPWAAIVLMAGLLLIPYVGIALFTRRFPAWKTVTMTAAGLAVTAGYLTLTAIPNAIFPDSPTLAAVLRVPLLFYAILAVRLMALLTGQPLDQAFAKKARPYTLLTVCLALALAALIALPWTATGVLGDRYTMLEFTVQALLGFLPRIYLFWEVLFIAFNRTFPRPWMSALLVILIAAAAQAGGVVPAAQWGALVRSLTLLPLFFLLTELRARESRPLLLLLVALSLMLASKLFTDPRDMIVQGIPELQHILSSLLAWMIVVLAAFALCAGRKLMESLKENFTVPPTAWKILTAGSALVLMIAWIVLYLAVGSPGFYDDGYLIILEEQADLSPVEEITDREARLQAAYDLLTETAERTQAPLRAELEQMGLPYRPYYITNMIRVDGHRLTMDHFQDFPGVASVILNPNVREYPNRIPFPSYGTADEPSSATQENLKAIDVEEAWDLGVTGEAIVVAGQDTGYDWTHPALRDHYRGWDGQQASHDYNWHDSWDDTAIPFDDDSHGTHTMGTMVGDDGGDNQTGLAPGAQWIGCRNMRRGVGNPASYAECMEYFLAPYPHGGDPFTDGDVSMAPHVINNSWGCPEEEGCLPDTLEFTVDALRAAGIMMVVSVGNEGPACESAATPPGNYDGVFSVGATDNQGFITSFSSRGPSGTLLKPDVSAPGAGVRSSIPGGGYGTASGTSMAGPHVAGLVALIWSADPTLIGDIEATEALICRTATPEPVEAACTVEKPTTLEESLGVSGQICACGDITGTPNNVYGCGIIDAEAAVRAALER